MAKKEKTKKQKQIIFSEEVDSAINGYAIGISFTGIGIFLLLKPDYFAIPVISYVRARQKQPIWAQLKSPI